MKNLFFIAMGLVFFTVSSPVQGKSFCEDPFKTEEASEKERALGKSSPEVETKNLFDAISNRDLEKVKQALENGADPNYKDSAGETAVHVAAKLNYVEALMLLNAFNADVNVQNLLKQTPAHLAVVHMGSKFLKELANQGANFEMRDEDGNTPFLVAVIRNNVDILEDLIGFGSPIDAQNNRGDTAFHKAVEFNYLDAFKELVRLGANIQIRNKDGKKPVYLALNNNKINEEIKNFLVKAREEFIEKANRNLNQSIREKDDKLLVEALDDGASIMFRGYENRGMIHLAAIQNYVKFFQVLVERNVITTKHLKLQDQNGLSVIHLAAINDSFETLREFKKMGADFEVTDIFSNTPLLTIVSKDKVEAFKELINLGSKINAVGLSGYTIAHQAALYDSVGIVQELIRLKFNMKTLSSLLGETPFHIAASHNSIRVLQELGRQNIHPVDYKTRYLGDTALHLAAHKNHVEAIKELHYQEANVNAQNSNGYTPLYMASSAGHLEAVKLLLDFEADPNIRSSQGKSALYGALKNEHEDIVELLKPLTMSEEEYSKRQQTRASKNKPLQWLNRIKAVLDKLFN